MAAAALQEGRRLSPRYVQNPHRLGASYPTPPTEPLSFHRSVAGYAPTPLLQLHGLSKSLGLEKLYVKVDHPRFGLPAFKAIGASWAVARALSARLHRAIRTWSELSEAAAEARVSFAAATDGNHGRAVARIARLLGVSARIFVPSSISPARAAAIASEGAVVEHVPGNYDLAVHEAQRAGSDECLVISDVATQADDPLPGWVIEGYETSLLEVDAQLAEQGESFPQLLFVQIGVGALAAAVVRHYRQPGRPSPFIIGVEPSGAACAQLSVLMGTPTMLPSSAESAMAGLNCEAPSLAAWPELLHGIDGYVAIEDGWAFDAMKKLHDAGVEAGESGAAGLAGLLACARLPNALPGQCTRALVFVTEGATDREAYERVLATPMRS